MDDLSSNELDQLIAELWTKITGGEEKLLYNYETHELKTRNKIIKLPKEFWDYPELASYYLSMQEYFGFSKLEWPKPYVLYNTLIKDFPLTKYKGLPNINALYDSFKNRFGRNIVIPLGFENRAVYHNVNNIKIDLTTNKEFEQTVKKIYNMFNSPKQMELFYDNQTKFIILIPYSVLCKEQSTIQQACDNIKIFWFSRKIMEKLKEDKNIIQNNASEKKTHTGSSTKTTSSSRINFMEMINNIGKSHSFNDGETSINVVVNYMQQFPELMEELSLLVDRLGGNLKSIKNKIVSNIGKVHMEKDLYCSEDRSVIMYLNFFNFPHIIDAVIYYEIVSKGGHDELMLTLKFVFQSQAQ
ncbi:hypothetical protein KAFR_0K00160 [Kazachstania africana CBS 2517]|uniref:Uncharacterized protein n=1 Tax=Kazachstania africana (strain ATCC 22294 / BCRC 22015 / CBS 2517 / CECT 1963 / NBRC 1671 / NRRL Y-8276) TaxID=1071382 RepID=H2B171_KAZAF|nr:hypothetical protein KAFR_0K00160 [Kazachstania africana CBS 2517]CCF60371.1 hypothetical protein KAFR_0K00160 [Kazachstania africana CBS 2517]